MEYSKRTPFFSRFRPRYFILLLIAVLIGGGSASIVIYYKTRPHWDPFPYISMLGETYPGTSVFGLTCQVIAMVGYVVSYLRYYYVEAKIASGMTNVNDSKSNLFNTNDASLVCGILLFGGLQVVGVVPYPISKVYHLSGAFTFFIGFLVYGFLQLRLSSTVAKTSGNGCKQKGCVHSFRSFLVWFALVDFLVAVSFFPDIGFFGRKTEWIAKTGEWILGLIFPMFYATFYNELEV